MGSTADWLDLSNSTQTVFSERHQACSMTRWSFNNVILTCDVSPSVTVNSSTNNFTFNQTSPAQRQRQFHGR